MREDPTHFYLVDPAEMSRDSPALPPRSVDIPPSQPRPHRRPGTVPRKTGSSASLSTTEAFGDGGAMGSVWGEEEGGEEGERGGGEGSKRRYMYIYMYMC